MHTPNPNSLKTVPFLNPISVQASNFSPQTHNGAVTEGGGSDRRESGKMRDKSEGEEREGEKQKLKRTEILGVERRGIRGGQRDGEVQTGEGMIGAMEDDMRWDEAACESMSLSREGKRGQGKKK